MPLLVAALLVAGCGGGDSKKRGLVWDEPPSIRVSPSGATVVIGRVRNESGEALSIRARDVKVVDARGRRIRSDAVFLSSYVRSNYPHNSGALADPSHYPEAEQQRVGFLVRMKPGASAPLTVSWRAAPAGRTAARIDYGKGYLPAPE